jgi:hypothetical protein
MGERPSLSLELVLTALRLAQAFSFGGGAGTTFSGSLEEAEPVERGRGEVPPGEAHSSSLPLNTSPSTERSLSRRRVPGAGQGEIRGVRGLH